MGNIEIIEEYRALAVRETQKAQQLEATLVALAYHCGTVTIPEATLNESVNYLVTPEKVDGGLRLTVKEKEKETDA